MKREIQSLSRFMKPYRRWAMAAPVLMALEVTFDLMQPRMVQHVIDKGITPMNMSVVVHTGLAMIGCALLAMCCGTGCSVFAVLTAQGFGADLRGALFRKVQTLSFANLDRIETGSLITRLTGDVNQVQEIVMTMMRMMVRAPLTLLGSVIMGVLTSVRLSVLYLLLIPMVVVVLASIMTRIYPRFTRVQQGLDAVNTVLQENLAGVRVVKAFARAVHESARFGRANEELMQKNIAAVRLSTLTGPAMMLILNTSIVAAVWLGGVHVSAGGLRVGQVIAFINYLGQTLFSLQTVSMVVVRVSRAQASAARVIEVLESEPALKEPPMPVERGASRGRLVFEDVSFSYQGQAQQPALRHISFVAEPGQTVAILGATGSGKSTIAALAARFYDPTEGRVTLDGVDLRDLGTGELRRAVGIALQESILFRGTIRDNIKYGRPGAGEDEVLAAARAAQADDYIRALPEGYDSVVGQRGVNLSGGQKQRLAIARALLPQPGILILDDSTSAVDVQTEARIQEALSQNARAQTRLIVAQRVAAVLKAHKILVLDDGAIVAEGTHQELLESSPVYPEIYESQMQNGVLSHAN